MPISVSSYFNWFWSLCSAVVLGVVLYGTFNVRLEVVELQGSYQRIDVAEVEQFLHNYAQKNWWLLDENEIELAIRQSVDWVDKAVITLVWPNKMLVRLSEQNALFAWNKHLVTSAAGVYSGSEVRIADRQLPTVSVSTQNLTQAVQYIEVLTQYFNAGDFAISSVNVQDYGGVEVVLNSGILLIFDNVDLPKKIMQIFDFLKVDNNLEKLVESRIDMRYNTGFAVGQREYLNSDK